MKLSLNSLFLLYELCYLFLLLLGLLQFTVIGLDLNVILADCMINSFHLLSDRSSGGQLKSFFSIQFLNNGCLVRFCLRLSLSDEVAEASRSLY